MPFPIYRILQLRESKLRASPGASAIGRNPTGENRPSRCTGYVYHGKDQPQIRVLIGRTTWFAGPSNLLFCDRTDSIEHEPTRRGYSRMRSSPPGLSAVFFP